MISWLSLGDVGEVMDDGDYASSTTTNRILTAVRDAAAASKELAAPLYSIQQELKAVHPFTRLKGDRLLKCLEREVKNGRLQKRSGRYYTLAAQSVSSNTATTSSSGNSTLRRSSKRKRTSRRLHAMLSIPCRRSSNINQSTTSASYRVRSHSPSDPEENTQEHAETSDISEVPFTTEAEDYTDQVDVVVRKVLCHTCQFALIELRVPFNSFQLLYSYTVYSNCSVSTKNFFSVSSTVFKGSAST